MTSRPASSRDVDLDDDRRPADVHGLGARGHGALPHGREEVRLRLDRRRRRSRREVEVGERRRGRVRERHQVAAVQHACGGAALRSPRAANDHRLAARPRPPSKPSSAARGIASRIIAVRRSSTAALLQRLGIDVHDGREAVAAHGARGGGEERRRPARDRARLRRLRDQLCTVASPEPEHGRRAEQVGVDALESLAQLAERGQRRVRLRACDEDRDEMAERRIAEDLAPLELAGEEPGDVVVAPRGGGASRRAGTSGRAPARARRGRSDRRAA